MAQTRNNAVVLIDLENLIEGYSLPKGGAPAVPLRRILLDLCDVDGIGGLAVLRAYANWSDPRLGALRSEINQLGIEPVQVFGLGRNGSKNVADIQLAVDAIDLAHVRPSLDTFVIVSGDGGFSALAKKLREYGKVVVGAGYRSSTNKVLSALCDTFCWIERPEVESAAVVAASGAQVPTDPRNRALPSSFEPLAPDWTIEQGLKQVRAVLRWYEGQIEGRDRNGLHLNIPREGIAYVLPGFTPKRCGAGNFSKLVARASSGTPVCLAKRPDGVAVLALRAKLPAGASIVGAEPLPEPHSEAHYRTLLGDGMPRLSFPPSDLLAQVVAWLDDRAPSGERLPELLTRCEADLGPEVDPRGIKRAILLLVNAGIFDRVPAEGPLSEQALHLGAHSSCARAIRDTLFRACLAKLEDDLETVDVAVLRGMIYG